jgi:HSP20 family molecular chaperone IbpA
MILFIGGSWKKIVEDAEAEEQAPRFDLEEREDRYVLRGHMPGFLQHGWQVDVEAGKLYVRGETQTRSGNGKTFGYVRSWPFEESFALPKDAISGDIEVDAAEHELSVVIPRVSVSLDTGSRE